MSNYIIGDIQGCYREFIDLLDLIGFDTKNDKLWLTGDMINRGPDSLAVINFLMKHQDSVIAVLGNHELHFLAIANKIRLPSKNDSIEQILSSPNCDEIIRWLRTLPLIYYSHDFNIAMVHAGIYPKWNLNEALAYGDKMHKLIESNNWVHVLSNMYGNDPANQEDIKSDEDNYRFILNVFTRMRYCSQEGELDLIINSPPGTQPAHLVPWYELSGINKASYRLFFGHWASLGIHTYKNVTCMDSGCVWGRSLTGFCIETSQFYSVPESKI